MTKTTTNKQALEVVTLEEGEITRTLQSLYPSANSDGYRHALLIVRDLLEMPDALLTKDYIKRTFLRGEPV
jgi:hypothetical protein